MIKWLWLSYRTLVFIIFHTQMGFMDVHPLSHSRCLVGFDPSLEWNGYIDFLKWTTKSPKSFDHYSIDTYGDLGNHHDFRDPHMDAMDGTYITGKNHRNDSSVPTVFFNLPGSPATLYVSVCIPGVMKRGGSKWCTHWPLWSLFTFVVHSSTFMDFPHGLLWPIRRVNPGGPAPCVHCCG